MLHIYCETLFTFIRQQRKETEKKHKASMHGRTIIHIWHNNAKQPRQQKQQNDQPMPANILHKALPQLLYFLTNVSALCDMLQLGSDTLKKLLHSAIISTLIVLNNFMRNRFTAKSSEFRSDLFNGQASRPYNNIGKHLLDINE